MQPRILGRAIKQAVRKRRESNLIARRRLKPSLPVNVASIRIIEARRRPVAQTQLQPCMKGLKKGRRIVNITRRAVLLRRFWQDPSARKLRAEDERGVRAALLKPGESAPRRVVGIDAVLGR